MTGVSIIIPTYNNAALFTRAINSVRCQLYKDYEIVVVDDSNSDVIEQVCHENKDLPIRYYHNEPSLGAVRNWNYGLSLAKGKYSILLHHDEEFISCNYLDVITKELEFHDVVVSNILINKVGCIHRGKFSDGWKNLLFKIPGTILFANYIGPCACVAFKTLKAKKFDVNLKWLVDMEWYYQLIKDNDVYYLKTAIIMSNHGHSDQISLNIDIKSEFDKDYKYILEKYLNDNTAKFYLRLGFYLMSLKKIIRRFR